MLPLTLTQKKKEKELLSFIKLSNLDCLKPNKYAFALSEISLLKNLNIFTKSIKANTKHVYIINIIS